MNEALAVKLALVVLGAFLTVSLALAGWALRSVVTIAKDQAVTKATGETRHEEYERRFTEFRQDLSASRAEYLAAVSKMQASVDGMSARLGTVHTEILVIKSKCLNQSDQGACP